MQEYKEQYYAGRERMNPDIERMITSNETPLSDNPAFPKFDKNGMPINFIELVAYKRFLDCVKKVKHYTKLDNISGNQGMMQLQNMLMSSVREVMQIESQHIPFLEKLAVEIVTKEMEIPNGAFLFDAKMVRLGGVDKSGFQQEEKNPSQSEIEQQFGGDESMSADELFEMEKFKRRFINILIQGSAKKGHYMFELVREKINQINPRLANLYGIIMSINDLTYWLMSDETIQSMSASGSGVAGKEEIDDTTIPPTIKATGIFHPVLVHEVIKGIMEVFGTHGLPDDEKSQQMIIQSVDTMSNEVWDIRVGAVCWEQFSKQYPFEIFEEGNKNIQHYLFARFCALDVEDFFESTPLILSNSSKGEKVIVDMVDDIVRDMKKRALRDALPEDDDEGYEEEFGVGGSIDDEVSYLGRRIRNLESMLPNVNTDERQDLINSIDNLKIQREGLLNKKSDVGNKKSFWFFKQGGRTKNPKKEEHEYDVYDNKRMLKNQAREVEHHSEELNNQIPSTEQVPAWVISKMERATTDLSDVTHYLDGENNFADGGGVDDFKMSYDEMTTYEKSNHIHYNPMNSRWEVTKNGESKEFWNQEQAEKYAGFEFDYEKDSRYSRKRYEALFGYADGGKVGEINYDIRPQEDKFIVVQITYKQYKDFTYPTKEFIRGFDGKLLEFDDMKSAQKFIDKIEYKYPYGSQKANVGMILMASQLMQKQEPQQPQVVYYVPQQEEQEYSDRESIIQNIPKAEGGGEMDMSEVNDFCMTNLIELADELQPLRYVLTERYSGKKEYQEKYAGKLVLVFKEPVYTSVVQTISNFIERAEDCHYIFEQSVNVSGSNPKSIIINLISENYTDREFKRGGKVYENTPKKINIERTKKITTELGDYVLSLITDDYVYYVNEEEGDENAMTIMYNKKGELISDNYFASSELYDNLLEQDEFEFISPNMVYNREEIIKENM